jgi:predicted lactoylglutathione lyase
MEQRLSLVTLGVANLPRARAFYEALGWSATDRGDDDIVFFQAGCLVIALWERSRLAEDTVVSDPGGWGGVTLAYCTRTTEEVDEVLAQAATAGGTARRPAAQTFWGGYSGVFTDPDGHPWEVAHNPFWTIREDGSTLLGR